MTTPPLAFGDYLAVFVPEDAYKVRVQGGELRYTLSKEFPYVGFSPPALGCNMPVHFILPLLEGKWEMLASRLKNEYQNNYIVKQAYLAAGGDPNANPVILRRIN